MPVTIRGEQYLSIPEAAQMAGRSQVTIRRWTTSGAIGAHRDGSGRWLIRLMSLEAYLRGEPEPHPRGAAESQEQGGFGS